MDKKELLDSIQNKIEKHFQKIQSVKIGDHSLRIAISKDHVPIAKSLELDDQFLIIHLNNNECNVEGLQSDKTQIIIEDDGTQSCIVIPNKLQFSVNPKVLIHFNEGHSSSISSIRPKFTNLDRNKNNRLKAAIIDFLSSISDDLLNPNFRITDHPSDTSLSSHSLK